MLLIIHNLPLNVQLASIKKLIIDNCGLTEVILDNLTDEGSGKCVTVGLVDEGDAALLVRKMNGLYVGRHQLYVEDARNKKVSDQPYRPPNIPAAVIPEPPAPPIISGSQPMQYDSTMQVQQTTGQTYSNMPFYMTPVQTPLVAYDKTSAVPSQSQVPFYQQQEQSMGRPQQPENQWISQPVVSYPKKQTPSTNTDSIDKEIERFSKSLSRSRRSPSRDRSDRNSRDRRDSPERSDKYRQRYRKSRPDEPYPRTRDARRSRSREKDHHYRRDEMRSRSKKDRSPPRIQRYGRPDYEKRRDDRGRDAGRRDRPYNKRDRNYEHRERRDSREYKVGRGRDKSHEREWDIDRRRDSDDSDDFERKDRYDYDRRSPRHFKKDDSPYGDETLTKTQSNYQSSKYSDDSPPSKKPRMSNDNVEKQSTQAPSNNSKTSVPVSNDSAISSNSKHSSTIFLVKHACAILTKQVMKNAKVGFIPNYRDTIETIFKCIESRLNVILEEKCVESLGEVLESYRGKFDNNDDPHFYKEVLEKMKRDKTGTEDVKNNEEIPQHKDEPDAAYANTGAIPKKKKGYVPPSERPNYKNKKKNVIKAEEDDKPNTEKPNTSGAEINEPTCVKCGKKGHAILNCPEFQIVAEAVKNIANINATKVKCFACGLFGHNATECPGVSTQEPLSQNSLPSNNIPTCHKCGQQGHKVFQCPGVSTQPIGTWVSTGQNSQPSTTIPSCNKCGQQGHKVFQCPVVSTPHSGAWASTSQNNQPSTTIPTCNKCGQQGHKVFQCPGVSTPHSGPWASTSQNNQPSTTIPTCNKCGQQGHKVFQCPGVSTPHSGPWASTSQNNQPSATIPTCNKCGQQGHKVFQCPARANATQGTAQSNNENTKNIKQKPICHKCGTPGHKTFQCRKLNLEAQSSPLKWVAPNVGTQPSVSTIKFKAPKICYKCGHQGHLVNDCKAATWMSRKKDTQSDKPNNTIHKLKPSPFKSLTEKQSSKPGVRNCYMCLQEGHTIEKCKASTMEILSSWAEKAAKQIEEVANPAPSSSDMTCTNCGQRGHNVETCRDKVRDQVKALHEALGTVLQRMKLPRCHHCSEYGHRTKECPDTNASGTKCFGCNERGHKAYTCEKAKLMFCNFCKKKGHSLELCRKKPNTSSASNENDKNQQRLNQLLQKIDTTTQQLEKVGAGSENVVDLKKVKVENTEENPKEVETTTEKPNSMTNIPICTKCNKQGHIIKNCEEILVQKQVKKLYLSLEEVLESLDPGKTHYKCFKCNQLGHGRKDCPKVRETTKAKQQQCIYCGRFNHASEKCFAYIKACKQLKIKEPKLNPVAKCFKCGEEGHKAFKCLKIDPTVTQKTKLNKVLNKTIDKCGKKAVMAVNRKVTQPSPEGSNSGNFSEEIGKRLKQLRETLDKVESSKELVDIVASLNELTKVGAITQQFVEVGANAQQLREAESSVQQREEAKASAQQCEKAEASAQQYEEAESSSQQYEKAEASSQQCEEAEASRQQCEEATASEEQCEEVKTGLPRSEEAEPSALQYEEATASEGQCKEVKTGIPQSGEAEPSAQQCEEATASVQQCEEVETGHPQSEEAEPSAQQCEEVKASAQQCEEATASEQQCEEVKTGIPQSEKAEPSAQQCEEAKASAQKCEQDKASPQKFEETKAGSPECEVAEASAQQYKEAEANTQQHEEVAANVEKIENDAVIAEKLQEIGTCSQKLAEVETDVKDLEVMVNPICFGKEGHKISECGEAGNKSLLEADIENSPESEELSSETDVKETGNTGGMVEDQMKITEENTETLKPENYDMEDQPIEANAKESLTVTEENKVGIIITEQNSETFQIEKLQKEDRIDGVSAEEMLDTEMSMTVENAEALEQKCNTEGHVDEGLTTEILNEALAGENKETLEEEKFNTDGHLIDKVLSTETLHEEMAMTDENTEALEEEKFNAEGHIDEVLPTETLHEEMAMTGENTETLEEEKFNTEGHIDEVPTELLHEETTKTEETIKILKEKCNTEDKIETVRPEDDPIKMTDEITETLQEKYCNLEDVAFGESLEEMTLINEIMETLQTEECTNEHFEEFCAGEFLHKETVTDENIRILGGETSNSERRSVEVCLGESLQEENTATDGNSGILVNELNNETDLELRPIESLDEEKTKTHETLQADKCNKEDQTD